MRAYVLVQPGDMVLQVLPRPVPAPDEVVVRVRAALTCGTDVKAFVRGHPKFPMPTPFGHEFAGDVAAVGSAVRGWREGDPVMAVPTAPCGHCYFCRRRQENLCDSVMETMVLGAYAEYLKIPARHLRVNVFAKPESLPYEEAALLEPLSCVLHGLESVALRPDDRVVLLGAGAISLLHLLTLRAMGAEHVAVVGRRPQRTEHARKLGADAVYSGSLADARDQVLTATDGRGADLVVECTGQVDVWEAALGFARRGGHVVLFGGCPPGTQVRIDTQRLHYDQVQIVSPFHATPQAVRRAYDLLVSEQFAGHRLLSGNVPLQDVREALARHERGDGIKFAVVP